MVFQVYFKRLRSMTCITIFYNKLRELQVAVDAAYQNRGLTVLILHVDINTTAYQKPSHAFSVVLASQVKRCRKLGVHNVRLDARALQKKHENLSVAHGSCLVNHGLT